MTVITAAITAELRVVVPDDMPRIQDLRLAELLGFERPPDIRVLIEQNMEELARYGAVLHQLEESSPPNEFWLTEEQALLICAYAPRPTLH